MTETKDMFEQISAILKAVKFCFVPLDGVIIRSGAKKHRNYTPVML